MRLGVRDSRPKFRRATTDPAGVPAADGVPSKKSGFAPRRDGVCCACDPCGVPAADGVPGEKSCCRGARDGVCCGRDVERVERVDLGVPFGVPSSDGKSRGGEDMFSIEIEIIRRGRREPTT